MARAEHFIIAGAQRAGTSYLVRLLGLHPEIGFAQPLRPEPKFFLRPEVERASLRDYAGLFRSARLGARLLGEKSTSYMESLEAPARIRSVLPEARLVFVLRDPVERAISNYWFSVQNGAETAEMSEAFLSEPSRRGDYDRGAFSVSPFAYLARGDYARHLRRFEDSFPREQMTILLFEDLVREPLAEARRLVAWLGADPDLQPAAPATPVNASRKSQDEVDSALRRFLIDHFREANRHLAERYGLDLSAWQGGRQDPKTLQTVEREPLAPP